MSKKAVVTAISTSVRFYEWRGLNCFYLYVSDKGDEFIPSRYFSIIYV